MAEEIESISIEDQEGIGSSDFRPHIPLPYATRKISAEKLTSTVSYATAQLTFTAGGTSEWLANHDFYPLWLLLEVYVEDESVFMQKHFEGFDLEMYRAANDYLLVKSITALEKPPVLFTTTPTVDWMWRKRFDLKGTRVLSTQTLTIDLKNCTEVSIDEFYGWVHGIIAKTT